MRALILALGLLGPSAAWAHLPDCPEGAGPSGAEPPAGRERLCIKADGTPHGPWQTWYDNGQLMSERQMRDGREHGIQRSWWPNGQLMMEGVSVDGNRYQGFKYWSPTGEPATVGTEIVKEPDSTT